MRIEDAVIYLIKLICKNSSKFLFVSLIVSIEGFVGEIFGWGTLK